MFSQILVILVLAVIQGIAELLPVSSSAHVIVAEKLMGIDPTSPQSTFLLVMLHTGTMFAAIVYFWQSWRQTYFSSKRNFIINMKYLIIATMATGIIGLGLYLIIKSIVGHNNPSFEIEHLFGNAKLMATALFASGILIIISSRFKERENGTLNNKRSIIIGAVQGLCLPFRGFSRSGATISTGLVLGVAHKPAEQFSFALSVVLTPVVIAKEMLRLYKTELPENFFYHMAPSLLGMILSFVVGLFALRWLSRWLEQDRWHFFGGYCIVAALFVLWVG